MSIPSRSVPSDDAAVGHAIGYERGSEDATYRAIEAQARALAAIVGPVWRYGDGAGGTVWAIIDAGHEVPDHIKDCVRAASR